MSLLHLLLLTMVPSVFQAAPSAGDVRWMSGCWDSIRNGRHVIEYWMPPEGGTLIGVSRTVADGRTVEWEFLMVREGQKGLEYVAKPSGQSEAVFVSTRVSPTEVIFENPAHDFPQRIIYKRDGDALVASIEGTRNGQLRRIDYPYTKKTCGS
jgi:hypothetical protein